MSGLRQIGLFGWGGISKSNASHNALAALIDVGYKIPILDSDTHAHSPDTELKGAGHGTAPGKESSPAKARAREDAASVRFEAQSALQTGGAEPKRRRCGLAGHDMIEKSSRGYLVDQPSISDEMLGRRSAAIAELFEGPGPQPFRSLALQARR
ncbi:hypothetical protein [Bradyrhizobium sp. Rc2d]|uniref:hypothetical protein n=1 Tax=Bradyrhizobium sp. Rc2d TaxID=1855321 RepID=UPI00115F7EC8|nr:hypothetical protein [Bradyrhizobium sp. Rc2d]